MMKRSCFFLLCLATLLLLNGTALASGFAIIEQSVSGLGNAYAGGSASAEDATTIFYNPAGMTRLEGQQVNAGLHVIIPSAKFSASQAPTNAVGAPIRDANGAAIGTGPSGGDGGKAGLVPNLYYSNKVSDEFTLGLGIYAPFGLTTDYDRTWAGRYHAKESSLMTLNINPAVAYKFNDRLSIGAGLNIQYIDATLSSMVDGGLINANLASQGSPLANLPMAGNPLNLSNPANDALVENAGDDWGFGVNFGLLYEFTPTSRIGFAYRSQIKHKLNGTVKSNLPASISHLAPLFQQQSINASITLPASASLSIYHKLTEKFALMADVSWTEWSRFKELVINFEGTGIAGQSQSVTTENWDDTWRYSLGATYQITEAVALRTGIAYDESPISDPYRTPRIPGNNRLWLAIGSGIQVTEKVQIDLAYVHLFVEDGKVNKSTTTPEDTARGNLVGSFENSVDIASAGVTVRF